MEVQHIVQTLKNVIKQLDDCNSHESMRIAGFIEGLLVSEGFLERTFQYQDIEVENPNVMTLIIPVRWIKPRIIRKENYQEYMKRKALEYVKENS